MKKMIMKFVISVTQLVLYHRRAGDGAGLCADAAAGNSGQYKEQAEQDFSPHGRGRNNFLNLQCQVEKGYILLIFV